MAWIAANKDPDGGDHPQNHETHTAATAAALGLVLSGGTTAKVYVIPSGAPAASVGSNGDYAFRLDGTGGATRFYQKAAGTWGAVTQVN